MDVLLKMLPLLFSIVHSDKTGQVTDALGDVLGKVITPRAVNTAKPIELVWVQGFLKANGFNPGEIDGDYGPQTAQAIRNYQAARGLMQDGWGGPATLAKMLEESNGK